MSLSFIITLTTSIAAIVGIVYIVYKGINTMLNNHFER